MKRVDALVSHKNVIEMNGRLYDAKSGRLLQGDIVKPSVQSAPSSIDGFVRSNATLIKPVSDVTPATQRPKAHRTSPAPVNHKRRNPQRSQILMRHVVSKPVHKTDVFTISSVSKVINSGERTMRAQATAKSPYIHRYSAAPVQSHITKKAEHIAVVEPPQDKPKNHVQHTQHVRAVHNKHPEPKSTSEQLFNKALENATPPPKTKHKTRKRSKVAKRSSIASTVLASFLLVGFIAYLNWPNLNLRLASSQAGFSAELPSYQPSGYSFAGPVSFEAGKVTVNFKSNTDDRAYSVRQEVSSWNSQSLEDNYLSAQNKSFEIQQEGGRTIYLYDKGKATWVNGGVWYQIDGQSLSPDQLVKIASSL